jgi:hypothetical protein
MPEDVTTINVSSQRPQDILNKLNLLSDTNPLCSVLLINADVWRYQKDPALLDYFDQDPRRFYIATLGYENKKLSHNVFELSFPVFCFTFSKTETVPVNLNKKCDYGFSCLNNNASFHRIVLGHDLYKNNLLSDMIFSQNKTGWPSGGHLQNILNNIANIDNYASLLPIRWPNETSDDYVNDHSINHEAYYNAYCNIPTESEIQDFLFEGTEIDLPIITEKSYKPFRSMQVPLFFAAKGHTHYLKKLGFEVMLDLVPNQFDEMGVFDKSGAIVEIVKKGRNYIENFYYDHLREIQHNFELIHSDNLEQKIYSDLKNFLSQ